MSNQGDAFKKGAAPRCRRRPIRHGSRVSPGTRCEEEQSGPWQRLQGGRRHPRVSPSPAKAGISPGLTPTPKSEPRRRTRQMATAAERLAVDVVVAQEDADHRRPPGTGRRDPVHRRLADCRHHHGAQQPTESGTTRQGAGRWHRRGAQQPAPRAPPRLPAATTQPPARTGPDGPGGHGVELQRQGRLRRGEDARLPSTSRRARRRDPRRLAAGQPPRTAPPPPEPARSHHARKRAPPPPSPPGLCPTGPPAAAEREGTRGEGRVAGGGGSPPCRLGLGDAGAGVQ
jgi:hypothetical protein